MSLTAHTLLKARRKLTRISALAVGAALVGSLMVACSTSPGAEKPSDGDSGGVLRIGVVDSTSGSLDPYANVTTEGTETATSSLFDTLTVQTEKGIEWSLATDMTANDDSTVWTVKLREGVKFHDGSEFTADDVIATFKRVLDPANAISSASTLDFMDPNGIKKIDDHTVEFDLLRPYGPFKYTMSTYKLKMMKKDSAPEDAIGTGPFSLKAFTPGQLTELTRFDDYWGGAPKLDGLEVISFKASDAVTNALLGGQIDLTSNIAPTAISAIESTPGLKVLQAAPGRTVSVSMRADVPPFDDVRVRQAMRLLIDRELVISNAFNGIGVLANDWETGNFPACEPDVPQRDQDIEKAKQLLAEAGQSNLTLELTTASNKPGKVEISQLLAAGAEKAGVTINVNKVEIGPWLDKYGEWPFYTTYNTATYLRVVTDYMSDENSQNDTHWKDPEFRELGEKLFATSDETEQCEIMKQMKKIQYDRGTRIYGATTSTISAHSDKVHGLYPSVPSGTLLNFDKVTKDSK